MAVEESKDLSPMKKRPRVDSEETIPDSPEWKRVHTDPTELYRVTVDLAGSDAIPLDLLDLEDEIDVPEITGLESVIKSFEDEILQQDPPPPAMTTEVTVSGFEDEQRQMDLGYLLGASDDDLGLPPTDEFAGSADPAATENGDVGVGFEDEIARYGEFGFGFEEELGWGFGAVDELSEYGDGAVADLAEDGFLWRPESLPAL